MRNKILVTLLLFLSLITVEILIGFSNIWKHFTEPKKTICIQNFKWDKLNYDEAKGYFFASYKSKQTGEFKASGRNRSIIINDFKLNKAVWNKKGVIFTKEDIDKLFNPEKYYDLQNTEIEELQKYYLEQACHEPHHGIVFRNKDGCPFAYINICFSCNTVKTYPKEHFPEIHWGVARLLFKEKGIKPTESHNEILQYSRDLRNNYNLEAPIYSKNSVNNEPEYISKDGENLIEFINKKGEGGGIIFTEEPTNDSMNISFVIEDNGELNMLKVPYEYNALLWLWESKWNSATKNGKKVRCRITKTIYTK